MSTFTDRSQTVVEVDDSNQNETGTGIKCFAAGLDSEKKNQIPIISSLIIQNKVWVRFLSWSGAE